MNSYNNYLPAYLREQTGRNAREWERRLRQWFGEHESLPTHHWAKVGEGSSPLGIWQLWRVQDQDPQLTMHDWMHEPAMHVLTKRTSTHGLEIVDAGFVKITPLKLPHDDLREVSIEAREKDLRERQDWITEPFDRETLQHINRLYAACVREHVALSLREGDLTLLRGELCVPDVGPDTPYADPLDDFKKKLINRANLRKRTASDIVEAVNRDMWWPQYRMVDDEEELPSLYLANIDLVKDWEPGFY